MKCISSRFRKVLFIILIGLTINCASYMPQLNFQDVDINHNDELIVYIDNEIARLKDTCIGLPEENAKTGPVIKNIICQCIQAIYPKHILLETPPTSKINNSNRVLFFKYKNSKFDGSKSDNWVKSNYRYHYQWYSYEIALSLEVLNPDSLDNKEIEIYGFGGEFKIKNEAIRETLHDMFRDLLITLETL